MASDNNSNCELLFTLPKKVHMFIIYLIYGHNINYRIFGKRY